MKKKARDAHMRQLRHLSVESAKERRSVAGKKAHETRVQLKKASAAHDGDVAAYLARNPVALCDQLETTLEHEDE